MKRLTLAAAFGLMQLGLMAQDAPKNAEPKEEGFVFTTVKELPITSVKNQNRAGTCWSYSGVGFLEAEALRMGKGEYDFSEMFIVHNTYLDRADAAVRTHGDVSFSQGGSFYDVIYALKNFGLVPEEEMRPGVMYNDTLSNHNELTAVSDAVVAAIAKGKLQKLQTDANKQPLWKKAIEAIHDIYLGKRPEKFTYKGKEYTPKTFAASTGLNPDDYVSLTSFTHHPYYEQFVLEIQDNWRWGRSWNLPLDEFMQVMDNAIATGYPIAWGSDVSEQGFTRDGVAVIPDMEKVQELSGSDMAHWLKLKPEEKRNLINKPQPQKWCTPEERQEAYDNWETTDDHGMLIYGTAKDQEGNEYFMLKNSWGKSGKYDGLWYASKAFVRYKTINILVHKNALPKDIAKKLGIK
jgi:aminopeptidase C